MSSCSDLLFNNDGTYTCNDDNSVFDPYDNDITDFVGPNNLPVKSQKLRDSYKECRANGFSNEFCLQTNVGDSRNGAMNCECNDGSLGVYLPGHRGKCICV